MTKLELAYIETLNTLGSDIPTAEIQRIVDHEHEMADPRFAAELVKRAKVKLIEIN